MAKFGGPSVQPGGPSVGLQEDMPKSSVLSNIIAQQIASEKEPAQPLPGSPAPEAAPIQQEPTQEEALAAQEQREVVPGPINRLEDTERVDTYRVKQKAWEADNDRSTDGGIQDRSLKMVDAWLDKKVEAGIYPKAEGVKDAPLEEIAQIEAKENAGSASAAFAAAGAVAYTRTDSGRIITDVDPAFLQFAALAAENYFADGTVDDETEAVDFGDETPEVLQQAADKKTQQEVARSHNNAKLGKQIVRDYARMKGQDPQQVQLDDANANTIGSVVKELYRRSNPGLVEEVKVEGSDQKYYRVTPLGAEVFDNSSNFRKKMFPKQHVRTSKTKYTKGRQQGEGKLYTKRVAGALETPVGAKTLKEASENLGQIPNVVNPQRLRILLTTMLPALMADPNNQDALVDVYATINNFGSDKYSKFKAKELATKGEVNAAKNLALLKSKIAQELFGIASERKGANFLTYYLQAFNGRLSPQQTHFDPTSSKAVRFVTTNATPVHIKPGSRQERNLRQMYAMMLVPGADMKLPDIREHMLLEAGGKLEAWGKRLAAVLGDSMTDAEAEAIADAIAQGIPMDNPNFPQYKPLALDPEADAELLAAIKKKGEDGPAFIDGLIDYANYRKSMRAGVPYDSFFNAYIDGKTNGLAANGIQMGSETVAYKTGVLRNSDTDLLDDGDLRDAMREILTGPDGWLNTTGWTGLKTDVAIPLHYISEIVFAHKPLNKATTMTFGYGKDMNGFVFDINETVDELAQLSREGALEEEVPGTFARFYGELNPQLQARDLSFGDMMLAPYAEALTSLMSPEAMASRGAMRMAATFSALMFEPMRVKTYTGYEQLFGGMVSTGWEGADTRTVDIKEDGKRSQLAVADYKLRPTATAIRRKKSGIEELGGKAYGGSVPGPVQSLDAATVALTVTGKSWDRLNAASNGKPYIHTIYDAFKLDANGYDVMLEEINNNWLKACMEWSYLEAAKDGYKQNKSLWDERFKDIPDSTLTTELEPGVDVGVMAKELAYRYTNSYGMASNGVKDMLQNFYPKPKKESPNYKEYWEKLDEMSENIMKAIEAAGWDSDPKSTEPMTVGQYKAFVNAFHKYAKIDQRFDALIKRTNDKKKDLAKKIKADGKSVYQYYAH